MKLIEKAQKIQESGKLSIGVVYVSGIDSITRNFNEKNYSDIESIEAGLEAAFGSDDYGIDDIWVDGTKVNLDWKNILSNGARLNTELVNLLFEEDADDMFIKMDFCNQMKYTIDESRLESITIYDGKRDNMVNGYPEGFIEEYVETHHNDILKALEKINADSYMDWSGVVSDAEINGMFSSTLIDGYFVYTTDV